MAVAIKLTNNKNADNDWMTKNIQALGNTLITLEAMWLNQPSIENVSRVINEAVDRDEYSVNMLP